jgi:hypothetical protein
MNIKTPILQSIAFIFAVSPFCLASGEDSSNTVQTTLEYCEQQWIAIDEDHTRYVLADYPIEAGLDYRTGGWINVEGQSFFLPHDLPTDQYQAIQNGLFKIPPKSNSKTAKALQTVSRVTAKTVLITTVGAAMRGYMVEEHALAISDFVDEVIYFAEQ